MLQEICGKMHNYFIKRAFRGTHTIADGMISTHYEIKDGQRFMINGSDLNDGIYTYHATGIMNDDDSDVAGLRDETFYGTICALSVPPAVIALSAEVAEWVEKYGATASSPYTSESVIGVYSYNKASGGSGAGGSIAWEDVFRDRLDAWRKVSP